MFKIMLGAIAAMAMALAFQTYRLDRCQKKADRLDVCQEVDQLERNARDATDDDLIDDITRP